MQLPTGSIVMYGAQTFLGTVQVCKRACVYQTDLRLAVTNIAVTNKVSTKSELVENQISTHSQKPVQVATAGHQLLLGNHTHMLL